MPTGRHEHYTDSHGNTIIETTGQTGALGILIYVLSPIDDFGEKNIMRLFVLFLDWQLGTIQGKIKVLACKGTLTSA